MNVHRLVALVSSAVLVGLIGVAQASNFAVPAPRKRTTVVKPSLREKVRNATINGCGG